MSELLSVLIVLAAEAAVVFFTPNTAVKFIVKMLSYAVKNDKMRDKVENSLGIMIAELGLGLISNTPDPTVIDDILKIGDELEAVKEKLKEAE